MAYGRRYQSVAQKVAARRRRRGPGGKFSRGVTASKLSAFGTSQKQRNYLRSLANKAGWKAKNKAIAQRNAEIYAKNGTLKSKRR